MPSARELSEAFYSGSLFGQPPKNRLQQQQSSFLSDRGLGPTQTFNQDAFNKATQAGYSTNDINRFLRDSGVKAEGAFAQVGGMATFEAAPGSSRPGEGGRPSESLYWQVTPGATAAPAPVAAAAVAAPSTANKVLSTTQYANGIGTIESVAALPQSVSAAAPILGDPLGASSQRVQRKTAKLSIAS